MNRIAILGRGGAGKSVLARRLGSEYALPVVELDQLFWRSGVHPTDAREGEVVQKAVLEQERWVIDGDLGPYDTALAARLAAAEVIVILDFPLALCLSRALRRSRETWEFWRWVLHYRRKSLPKILSAIATDGNDAQQVYRPKSPREIDDLMAKLHISTK